MTNSRFAEQDQWSRTETRGKDQRTMGEERIAELVDRFYSHLTKDPYYSSMFVERNVDMDTLKERQKAFISRLVNGDSSQENQSGDQSEVEQVQRRHPFRTTPEKAKIWMDTMRKTMDEMRLEQEIRELLLTKMQLLMDKIIRKEG